MALTAQQLFAKYGNGLAKSSMEVYDFLAAMRAAGLTEAEACVAGAWLGGAPPEKFEGWKFWDYTHRQTAKEACDTTVNVADAMQVLAKRDVQLFTLAKAKAEQKQWKEDKSEAENVDQDVAELKDRIGAKLSFDLAGITITPKDLAIGLAIVVTALIAWRAVSAVRAVAG